MMQTCLQTAVRALQAEGLFPQNWGSWLEAAKGQEEGTVSPKIPISHNLQWLFSKEVMGWKLVG